MKKILVLVVALVIAGSAAARQPQQSMRRSEVSVSYGAFPATGWIDSFSKSIINAFVDMDAKSSNWGAITVGYNYRLTQMLSLGGQVVYASGTDTYSLDGETAQVNNRYWSLMPNLKVNWYSGRLASLYSRVGVGATFMKASIGDASETETRFAFQVSALGLEVGGRLAAYAEVGLGTSGSLLFGARYRF